MYIYRYKICRSASAVSAYFNKAIKIDVYMYYTRDGESSIAFCYYKMNNFNDSALI